MLNDIIENYPDEEFLRADGFDEAVIGVSYEINRPVRLVYSMSKCLDILLKRDNITYEEAQEFFSFNVEGAYVGEQTPIWCNDII